MRIRVTLILMHSKYHDIKINFIERKRVMHSKKYIILAVFFLSLAISNLAGAINYSNSPQEEDSLSLRSTLKALSNSNIVVDNTLTGKKVIDTITIKLDKLSVLADLAGTDSSVESGKQALQPNFANIDGADITDVIKKITLSSGMRNGYQNQSIGGKNSNKKLSSKQIGLSCQFIPAWQAYVGTIYGKRFSIQIGYKY